MLVLLLFASILADPLADQLAPAKYNNTAVLPEDDPGSEDFAQGLAGSREGPVTIFFISFSFLTSSMLTQYSLHRLCTHSIVLYLYCAKVTHR